jgi:hypothetical protein
MNIYELIKNNISLLDYAQRSGFTPIKKGKYYSLKEHDSVMIDVGKNCYWQNSIPGVGSCIGKQGDVIDFAVNFNGLSFSDAVKELSEEVPDDYNIHKKRKESSHSNIRTELILPPHSENMRKIYAYLIQTRHIAPEVIQELVNQKMLYQDTRGNCVFVGYDVKNPNEPVFACKRGSNTYKPFYGDVSGSNYERCFYLNYNSKKLVISESIIDAMSVMTLMCKKWKDYNYLALAGIGKWEAVKFYLENQNIKEVYITTDNDRGGIGAAKQICRYIKEYYPNIICRWKLPPKEKGKDWNNVLQTIIQKK